jgi:hypothetical protein
MPVAVAMFKMTDQHLSYDNSTFALELLRTSFLQFLLGLLDKFMSQHFELAEEIKTSGLIVL